MMKYRKIFIGLMLIAFGLLSVSIVFAGDGTSEWKAWTSKKNDGGFDGHGGFFYGYQLVDFKDLKDLAKDMGIEVPKNGLRGWGGFGMGNLGGGFRIGGAGYGFWGKYSGVAVDTGSAGEADDKQYNRVMEVSISGGGVTLEYSPWMIGPVNYGFGVLIGGGSLMVRLHQDDGTFSWNDLTGQYTDFNAEKENIVTEISQGFFILNPYLAARIHILDWMAVDTAVGYNFNTANSSGWYFGDREIAGEGSTINPRNFYFRVGMAFGG